jgi:hypothetical protein
MKFQVLQRCTFVSQHDSSNKSMCGCKLHLSDLCRPNDLMNYFHPKVGIILGQFSTSWDFSPFSSFSRYKSLKFDKYKEMNKSIKLAKLLRLSKVLNRLFYVHCRGSFRALVDAFICNFQRSRALDCFALGATFQGSNDAA